MHPAAALDPEALYKSKIAQKESSRLAVTLALKNIASSPSRAEAMIEQYSLFSAKKGLFGGEEARCSAVGGRISLADWWASYGGECKELQKLVMRIVSQCMSSSGCERNWSTFALVYTKLRNWLSYPKLHKLVKVHYNLKLRIQQFESDFQKSQELKYDPCSWMMDVTLFDENNPIMDWLCNSMSESTPTIDEYESDDPESFTPSTLLLEQLGIESEEIVSMKREYAFWRKGDSEKRALDEEYDSDSSHESLNYDEGDSNSDEDNDDGDDGGGGGGDEGARLGREALGDGGGTSKKLARPRSTRKRKPVKSLYNIYT